MKTLLKFAAVLLMATSHYSSAKDRFSDDTPNTGTESVETIKPCQVCASVRFEPVETGPEKTEIELSKERCDEGDYSSCVIHEALTFSPDQPPEISTKAAFESFKTACEQGDLKRCRHLAELYVYGTGVKENHDEAVRLTQEMCDLDFAPSCFDLGRYAEYGLLKKRDDALIRNSYAKSCAGDFTDACDVLVEEHIQEISRNVGNVSKTEYEEMVGLAKKSCDLGSAYSCIVLSTVYKTGQPDIVEVDLEKSVSYLDRACSVGDPSACSNLIEMYRLGDGVDENPAKQFEYSLTLCGLGSARGCALVGTHYNYGDGVKRNIQSSIEYETKACEMGFSSSCGTIADYYRDGEYVDQDVKKAVSYYKQACNENASDYCGEVRNYIRRVENNLPDPNAPKIAKAVTAQFGSAVLCAQGYKPDVYGSDCSDGNQDTGQSSLIFYVEGDEYISINPDSLAVDALVIDGIDAKRNKEKGFNFQLRESEVTMNENQQPYLPLTIIIREGLKLNSTLELRASVTANYSDSIKQVVSQPFSVANVKSLKVGPAQIKGNEFSDLRYGLEHVARNIKGAGKKEVDILQQMIESKGVDFTQLGLDISQDDITRLGVSPQQQAKVTAIRDAYEQLRQRWIGGGSGLDDYNNFNLDITSGARFIKQIVLLEGDNEIEGSDTGFSLDGDDSAFYSFIAPSTENVRIKIVYWDDPKVAKINIEVVPD